MAVCLRIAQKWRKNIFLNVHARWNYETASEMSVYIKATNVTVETLKQDLRL